jgi:hypothetical protein
MKDHHYYPDRIQLQETYALKLPVYEEVLENFLRRLDRDLKERACVSR